LPQDYIVQPGDCLHSIASDSGLSWQKIWNHPENSNLKSLRESPNIIKEGDEIFVPDPEINQVSCATDQNHVFELTGLATVLKLRILEYEYEQTPPSTPQSASPPGRHVTEDDPELDRVKQQEVPRANVPFKLEINGIVINGKTDHDGVILQHIPPDAQQGTLTIEPDTLKETVIPLLLGFLDPVSEISGIWHRLSNLGFDCGDQSDEITPDLQEALRQFQLLNDMPVTGQLDDTTKSKLKQLHGS
jgi:hypothetical protein